MKIFNYKALDKNGSLIKDSIEANNISDVEIEIEKKKLIAIKISERKNIFSFINNNKKELNLTQTSEFISNFSMMISTGLTIKNTLEALKESTVDKSILSLVKNTLDNPN